MAGKWFVHACSVEPHIAPCETCALVALQLGGGWCVWPAGRGHEVPCVLPTCPRALHLSLTPHPTIWSKDFSAVTEDGHGRQTRLSLNRNHFYTGTVLGRSPLTHPTPS